MDGVTLLSQAQAAGLTVHAEGELLVVRGPRSAEVLAQTLLAHKAELMPLLTVETPCPTCGASDWRETPDAGRWCQPCVLAGRESVAAVKVHSDALNEAIWVVADDLPREAWPTDAPVYTQAEVKILTQVGPDVLAWVHATKTMFGAEVVVEGGGGQPRPLCRREIPSQRSDTHAPEQVYAHWPHHDGGAEIDLPGEARRAPHLSLLAPGR